MCGGAHGGGDVDLLREDRRGGAATHVDSAPVTETVRAKIANCLTPNGFCSETLRTLPDPEGSRRNQAGKAFSFVFNCICVPGVLFAAVTTS